MSVQKQETTNQVWEWEEMCGEKEPSPQEQSAGLRRAREYLNQ